MSFDRLAPHYTWMEAVLAGRRLQHCRVAWLDALAGCSDILIAGVGHGHFLSRCARRFPQARITSIDASAGMLRRAEQRAIRTGARRENLTFVHAALPDWTPAPARYDAIVTPFFLDCFAPAELDAVIATLAAAGRPRATWLVSDFTLPARGVARLRAQAIHGLMYTFFRPVTQIGARRVTPPDASLAAHGFRLVGRRSSNWGLLHADLWRRG